MIRYDSMQYYGDQYNKTVSNRDGMVRHYMTCDVIGYNKNDTIRYYVTKQNMIRRHIMVRHDIMLYFLTQNFMLSKSMI